MTKRFIILLLIFSAAGTSYAQWTRQDSLKLQRILQENGELKLNPEAVKRIDFGNVRDSMRISEEKNWMQPDETLPKVEFTKMEEAEVRDSLYKEAVKRGEIPLSSKRIPLGGIKIPGHDNPATGMSLKLPPPEGISLGKGVRVSGGTISGLDLMRIFTKDFWNRKQKKRRERTRAILRSY